MNVMLPPALLDLTLLRFSAPSCSSRTTATAFTVSRHASTARHSRHTPLAPPPPRKSAYQYGNAGPRGRDYDLNDQRSIALESNSLAARAGQIKLDAGAELARRVKDLEQAVNAEKAALDPPTYSEEDLMLLYEDVLALPSEPEKAADPTLQELEQQQFKQDMAAVCAAEERAVLNEQLASSSTPLPPYRRLLIHTQTALSRIEAARETIKLSPNPEPSITKNEFLPVTLLTFPEFGSILRLSIRAGDAEAADLTLDLMKRSGLAIPEDMLNPLLKVYASAGNVQGAEQVLVRYLNGPPTPKQRHYHIKSHLISTPANTIPSSALALLHSYETQALHTPIHTYTSVITSLFRSNSSLGRAQAWDLFSHMRYVAHGDPDVALYTLMIRACASPVNVRPSEPEKALDLWTEMTVDRRLSPTAGAYDAVILACARSGRTTYVNEAIRLAKEMLDSHRDARGESAFKPSRRTYCALLEGTKRVGDLSRARWILAQMIAGSSEAQEAVNEEVMMHVFHTYASYRPPFTRNIVKPVEVTQAETDKVTSTANEVSPADSPSSPQQMNIAAHELKSAFSHIPPQSGAEVIHEVQILYDRILYDSGMKTLSDPTDGGALPAEQKFMHVVLTPRLLNSYLAVHYKHASFEDARDLYRNVFAECGVPRTGRTYVEALERCAIARRGHERMVVMEFADEVWAQWLAFEEVGHENGRPLSGRMIEKAHIAMIRALALTNNTEGAMEHLREFAARYPPSNLRTPAPKPAMRSTRTVLVGERPLVRMTSNLEIPDDHVPPLVMFNDIEILHHRLVARRAAADIKYLAWVCKAYEGALRARRDAALRMPPMAEAVPVPLQHDVECVAAPLE
ncbi:hypothetical protein DXG01_000960 [Tephrocybe rancida]|nr:hypothetical protein DXG01_000960 [Tephrocybe rancida]